MTKDKKNQEDVRGALEDALLKALESEAFIEGLSRKVAEKLEDELVFYSSPRPETQWKRSLEDAGLTLAEGCTLERIVELFPLTAGEIGQVTNRIKTGKQTEPLTIEGLQGFVTGFLGEKSLQERIADKINTDGGRCIPFSDFTEPICSPLWDHIGGPQPICADNPRAFWEKIEASMATKPHLNRVVPPFPIDPAAIEKLLRILPYLPDPVKQLLVSIGIIAGKGV